jgi:transposase
MAPGHLKELDRQARELEAQIAHWHERSEPSRRLAKIPGIGPITASVLVASISDVRSFKNGRQLGAWVGLVPHGFTPHRAALRGDRAGIEVPRLIGNPDFFQL